MIEHREPHFHLERTHVNGKNSDTFTIDLTTDNETITKNHGGMEIHAHMFWQAEALVFDSEVRREVKQGKNVITINSLITGKLLSLMNSLVRQS